MSPTRRPALMMSCRDWYPVGMKLPSGDERLSADTMATGDTALLSGSLDSRLVTKVVLPLRDGLDDGDDSRAAPDPDRAVRRPQAALNRCASSNRLGTLDRPHDRSTRQCSVSDAEW